MLDDIRNKAQSWGVKIIFGIIIVVFVFWGVGNFMGPSASSLATVNGEPISMADYEKVLSLSLREELQSNPDLLSNPEQFAEYKRLLLDELIMSRLRLQEAERLGIIITPHELKKQRNSHAAFHDVAGNFSEEQYRRMLEAVNLTPGDFLSDLEQSMLEFKLMRYIGLSGGISEKEAKTAYAFALEKRLADFVLFNTDDYLSKAVVGDDEIAKFYEENKERFRLPARASLEFLRLVPDTLANGYAVTEAEAEAYYKENTELFRNPEMFEARQIFIPAPPEGTTEPGADESLQKAREEIVQIQKGLEEGEDFAKLAETYSKDQDTARIGGVLGTITLEQFEFPEIGEAVRKLEQGQVTEPVRTVLGYYIVKLDKKTASSVTSFAEAKERITSELARRKVDDDFANIHKTAQDSLDLNLPLAEIGDKFKVTAEKSPLASEEDLEKSLGLNDENQRTMRDFIATVAASGEAATIPVPVNIKDGIALVRVLEARPSQIQPLDEVRAPIMTELRAAKAGGLARADAEQVLPSFTGQEAPEAYKDKIQQSRPAIRVFPSIEPLGEAPDLVDALFSSSGGWLPEVFFTPKGAVIARLASVETVKDEEWEQFKTIFVGQTKQAKASDAVRAFMVDILAKAQIESSDAALEQLQPRR